MEIVRVGIAEGEGAGRRRRLRAELGEQKILVIHISIVCERM